jgi:hypothetical protein
VVNPDVPPVGSLALETASTCPNPAIAVRERLQDVYVPILPSRCCRNRRCFRCGKATVLVFTKERRATKLACRRPRRLAAWPKAEGSRSRLPDYWQAGHAGESEVGPVLEVLLGDGKGQGGQPPEEGADCDGPFGSGQ